MPCFGVSFIAQFFIITTATTSKCTYPCASHPYKHSESSDHGPINSWDRQPFITTVNTRSVTMCQESMVVHSHLLAEPPPLTLRRCLTANQALRWLSDTSSGIISSAITVARRRFGSDSRPNPNYSFSDCKHTISRS